MKVNIERIKILERIRKEITKIDELAEDFKINGQINPITVMAVEGDMYQLLAGLRRLMAAKLVGWKEIEVKIVVPADAEAALRLEISENEQRVDFTFSEQMDFARLLNEIEEAKARERMSRGGKGGLNKEGVPVGAPLQRAKRRDVVAGKIGMGRTNYECAKYIAENAPAEIIEELDNGKRKIRPTYDELRAKDMEGKEKQSPAPADSAQNMAAEDKLLENYDCDLDNDFDNDIQLSVDSEIPVAKVTPAVNEPLSSSEPPPAKEPPANPSAASLTTPPKPPKPKPLKEPPAGYMSKQDEEALRKIKEFAAMSPEEKITELQAQLKAERARAATAESELSRLKELRHNDNMHNGANINNLKLQIKTLNEELGKALARIKELEGM